MLASRGARLGITESPGATLLRREPSGEGRCRPFRCPQLWTTAVDGATGAATGQGGKAWLSRIPENRLTPVWRAVVDGPRTQPEPAAAGLAVARPSRSACSAAPRCWPRPTDFAKEAIERSLREAITKALSGAAESADQPGGDRQRGRRDGPDAAGQRPAAAAGPVRHHNGYGVNGGYNGGGSTATARTAMVTISPGRRISGPMSDRAAADFRDSDDLDDVRRGSRRAGHRHRDLADLLRPPRRRAAEPVADQAEREVHVRDVRHRRLQPVRARGRGRGRRGAGRRLQPAVRLGRFRAGQDPPAARHRALRAAAVPRDAGAVRLQRGIHQRLHQLAA